jgi:hypothetical protein
LDIDVDINNTAAANARWFYQAAKDAKAKEIKTMEVSAEWLKRAAKYAVQCVCGRGRVRGRVCVRGRRFSDACRVVQEYAAPAVIMTLPFVGGHGDGGLSSIPQDCEREDGEEGGTGGTCACGAETALVREVSVVHLQ